MTVTVQSSAASAVAVRCDGRDGMPGLALKLAPREQVLINGVVVENGPRRTQIVIMTEDAAILRLREALSAEDVIGPASRAYFAAQQALSDPLVGSSMMAEVAQHLDTLKNLNTSENTSKIVDNARRALEASNYYRTMRVLKPLVEAEASKSERAAPHTD